MKRMKYIFCLLGVSCTLLVQAQNVTPQVINAGGMTHTLPNGATLTDNIGEVAVATIGAGPIVTQGFLQPARFVIPQFTVDAMPTDVSCSGKDDGRITTNLTASANNYTLQYIWTPTTVCPSGTCATIDSLKAGLYTLQIVASYSIGSLQKNDTLVVGNARRRSFVITDVNGPCKVKVFSGVSMNNDGLNDFFFIENIEEYPNNRLTVYNRWGVQLYDHKGYDNVNNVWPAKDEDLVSSTYFYILDIGDGSKPVKGWVEVIKN